MARAPVSRNSGEQVMKLQSKRGFTLIEVMIVVAVIGILAAIGLPSYREYVARGHRADARTGLLQAQQWLERASTARGTYPTTAGGATTLPATLTWAADASKRYTIGFRTGSTNNNSQFTLIATRKPGGAQATDRCGDFTLTHTGTRGSDNLGTGATSEDCWNR